MKPTEKPRKKRQDSASFIAAVKKRMAQGGEGPNAMAGRELGQPPGRYMAAYEAFIEAAADAWQDGGGFRVPLPEGAFYLAACVCCRMEKRHGGGRYVRFEELMHRARKTDSAKSKASRLLEADWDEHSPSSDEAFRHKFMDMFYLCEAELRAGETLSCAALLDDLRGWNAPGRRARKRWAVAMCIGPKPAPDGEAETDADSAAEADAEPPEQATGRQETVFPWE